MMKTTSRYFIIAGETSGDQHAALLMRELKKINNSIVFSGIGGPNMKKHGLESLFPIEELAVLGFWEVFLKLVFFLKLEKKIIKTIKETNPIKIILIDYPGLNLRVAKKIKAQLENVEIIYYITPQVWAWKEKRIKILKNYVDKLFVIFPFEKDWFGRHNIKVDFLGHPFLDGWVPSDKNILKSDINLNINKPVLTLFPGSRKQELKKHLDILVSCSLQIKAFFPELQFVLGLAPGLVLNKKIPDFIYIEKQYPQKALECSDFAILASGTSTIEATIFNIPSIVIYRSSFFTWFLAKLFVKSNYIAMSNLLANKEIMPEFLQYRCRPNLIVNKFFDLFNESALSSIKIKLGQITKTLGPSGASSRIAKAIIDNVK